MDLSNVVLVNNAFHDAGTPLLYRTLSFSKNVKSPIPTLFSENRSLVTYVHNFVIEESPDGRACDMDPSFLEESLRALELCDGLRRFHVNLGNPGHSLRAFLPVLLNKSFLRDIEFTCASAISEHEDVLTLSSLRNLRRIALRDPSWQLINKLPEWAKSLAESLKVLEITSSECLNSEVLKEIVVNLPNLREMNITSCPKVNHDDLLGMAKHIPLLERLSLSIWLLVNPDIFPPLFVGANLRHLTLDMKNGILDKAHCTPFWKGFLTSASDSGSKLISLTLHPLRKVIIGVSFVKHIRRTHGNSLTVLELRNIVVSSKVLGAICSRLSLLEELALTIHGASIIRFAEAFARSSTLRFVRNLTDRSDQSQTTLNNLHVRRIACTALSVTSIKCQGRKWDIMRNQDRPKDIAILYTARGRRHI